MWRPSPLSPAAPRRCLPPRWPPKPSLLHGLCPPGGTHASHLSLCMGQVASRLCPDVSQRVPHDSVHDLPAPVAATEMSKRPHTCFRQSRNPCDSLRFSTRLLAWAICMLRNPSSASCRWGRSCADLPLVLDASTPNARLNFTLTTESGDLDLIGEVARLGGYEA